MDTGSEKLTDRNPPEMSFTNTKNRYLVVVALMIWFIPQMDAQTFVPFKQRLANGGVNLKGDITFIANSIVSKNQDGTVPNDNYNGSESNNRLNLQ